MNPERPLAELTSIKAKLAILVGVSLTAGTGVAAIGEQAALPWWLTLPVTLAAALTVTHLLARGMTAPLRQMTTAARSMASGEYGTPLEVESADEVGQLARAFTTMSGELAAADRHRRELIATVSHELRTPLAAQRALLENLADGVVTPDSASLTAALGQAERLSGLVSDLLDLSRLDAGVTALSVAPVDLAALVDRAVAQNRLAHPEAVVTVQVPAALRPQADERRVEQVVANLLDNAVRHGGSGVLIEAAAGDDGWFLQVSDRGPGIPADLAERVWRRFGSGDDRQGGTGLGLSIARWVCELHGGTLQVLTDDAAGARVRAWFPTTDQPRAVPVPPEAGVPAAGLPAAQTAGAADAVVGSWWPEADGRPRPGLLLASVAAGTVAALALPYQGNGLALALVLALCGGIGWSASARRTQPWTLTLAGLCASLLALVVIRADGAVTALAIASGMVLLVAALTAVRTLPALVVALMCWPLSALRGLPLLGRSVASLARHGRVWPMLRTAAVCLVALTVFGALFASADAVFGQWAQAVLPDLAWDSLTLRTFVLVFVAGFTLTASYLALNPPRVHDVIPSPGGPVTRPWEWYVPMGLVVATFAVFLAAQGSAMFGGHEYLHRTTGLSYAEYVHQGFGQLTVATALTLLVLAIARRAAPRAAVPVGSAGHTAPDRWSRLLMAALALLTLCVVASALYRMHLYQQAYGFTTLRLFVDGFEVWLGLLVAMVLVATLTDRWAAVPRVVIVSGAVFALAYGLMNPAGWVARHNIQRYDATGLLDVVYLRSLPDDAAGAIVEGLGPARAACVLDGGRPETTEPQRSEVLSFNLGRASASSVIADLPTPADAVCAQVDQIYDGVDPGR